MDSNVTLGNGVGIVTAIGMDTSIGKIAEVIQKKREKPSKENGQTWKNTFRNSYYCLCIYIHLTIPQSETAKPHRRSDRRCCLKYSQDNNYFKEDLQKMMKSH